MKHDRFVPRSVTTNQLHFAARTIQFLRQKFDQGLIGRRIHWRRGDFDFQFITEGSADFIFGSARLELDQKQSAAGGFTKKGRGRHGAKT